MRYPCLRRAPCAVFPIRDSEKFQERMRSRHTEDSTDENPRYEEKFRVIKYK